MGSKKIMVFCPNPYSLYTVSVCELLMKRGYDIECIFVRKFTLSRFKKEFARDGKRLFKKIWNKLILREKAYLEDSNSIITLRNKTKLSIKHVKEFKDFGTKLIYCNSLNDKIVEDTLKLYDKKLVVFTGGGIIRKNILDNAGDGIINCHMGVLPRYKGMDLPEWCILEEEINELGITLHFMDSGIDTGDILKIVKIPLGTYSKIKDLRRSFEPIMVNSMVTIVGDYLNGNITRRKQPIKDKRQYFIIHEKLSRIVDLKLKMRTVAGKEVDEYVD